MNEQLSLWLKSNSWAIIIAIAGIVSTYSLISYRVDALEKQVSENRITIENLKETNQLTAIDIARIQTDIAYIKIQFDRILPPAR